MPQQIDVRDHRKCNDHDSLRIRSAAPDARDAEPFGTCVEMSTLARTRRGLRKFGSLRQWRYIDTRSTYISTEIVVARCRGVSRATGKANLARTGLTARCAGQHGVPTAKSRRRAGCRVRSSGRRQSCGECDRANSHPAETGNRRGGPAEWG